MEFELKAAQPPTPISYQIVSNDTNGVATLERLEWERPIPVTNRSRAAELIRQ
jgi:hypothetical protein